MDRLLDAGHEVVCLDNFDSYYDIKIKEQNVKSHMCRPGLELIRGSILDDAILKRSLAGVDYVFHCAARAGIRGSINDPLLVHEVNASGTLMVLEGSLRAGVKKVIQCSSSSVYGNTRRLPVREDDPTHPISPYGVSKLCAENYCEVYRDIHGLDTTMLRYFTVYGPRMRPDLAIAIFTGKALAGMDINIFGDGNKSRDFTYIDDIVDATAGAMSRGSGIYNIGSGNAITINDLARMIVEFTGSRSRIKHHDKAPGDIEHTLADISRAKKDLEYSPKVDIAEGIKRYIQSQK